MNYYNMGIVIYTDINYNMQFTRNNIHIDSLIGYIAHEKNIWFPTVANNMSIEFVVRISCIKWVFPFCASMQNLITAILWHRYDFDQTILLYEQVSQFFWTIIKLTTSQADTLPIFEMIFYDSDHILKYMTSEG